MQRLLKNFFSNDRNGYFHKDNLHARYDANSSNEVERIRHQAMLLHFLILGSCVIDEDCRESLRIPAETPSVAITIGTLESRVVGWIEAILKDPVFRYRVSAGAEAIVLRFDSNANKEPNPTEAFVSRIGMYWDMRLSVFASIDEIRKPIIEQRPGVYKAMRFEWEESGSREYVSNEVANILLSLDWNDLLAWTRQKPAIVLCDQLLGNTDIRTGSAWN